MRHVFLAPLCLLSLLALPALAAGAAAPAASKPVVAAPASPAAPAAPTPPASPVPQEAAPPPAEAEPPPEAPRPPPGGRIEDRLRAAHDGLQLTTAQAPLWDNVLKVLDENQKTIAAINSSGKPLNALGALQQNGKVAETRAAGLKRLTGAVEKLYDALSDGQKKQLDQALAMGGRRPNLP